MTVDTGQHDGADDGADDGAVGGVDAVAGVGEPTTTDRVLRAGRWPLVVLVAIYSLNISHQYLLSAVFPLVKAEFRLSDTQLGLLGGSFLLLSAVGAAPFGMAADRVRRTRMLGWGNVVWGGAMVWSGLSGSYAQLFAARSMLGVTDAIDNPAAYSLITDYYPVADRGRIFGIYNIGQVGGIFAIPIGGIIADVWGWREAFLFFAVPAFILAVVAWYLREPERGQQDRKAQSLDVHDRPSPFARMSLWQGYKTVLRIPSFLVTLGAIALTSFFTRGLGIWAATFLIRYHDMAVATATSALALLAVGGVVGSVTGGIVADRLVRRGIQAGRVYLAGICYLASVAILFPAFATDNTALMLVLFGIGAAFLLAPQPVLNAAYSNVIHPHLRGRGNSSDQLTQTMFGAVSPLALGLIADATTLRTAILTLLPFMALAGVVLLSFGPRLFLRDEDRMREELALETTGPGGTV